jgi:hypothetical protein
MMPLSLAIAGPVSDAIGVQTWYIFGGATFALMGILTFFIPAVARLEDGRPDAEGGQLLPEAADVALAGE